MKDFLELISKIRKSESSSEDSMSSEENKDECPLTVEEIIEKFNNYKSTGNAEHLEILNTYSFQSDVAKVINDELNKMIIQLYEQKEYEKLAYVMDEFHRDSNFLDGAVLCEMILIALRDDDLKMLLCLLLGDYANYWNDFHIQKAWQLIIDNLDNNNTVILRALREGDNRIHISDILF